MYKGDVMNEKYEILLESWATIKDNCSELNEINLDELKHLIYNTYHFFKSEIGESKEINRSILALYNHIAGVSFYFVSNFAEGMTESVSSTFEDFLLGLCYVIEEGFDAGYTANPLPLGLGKHTPAGCANPEAEMTSYESFEKAFDKNVHDLQENCDME